MLVPDFDVTPFCVRDWAATTSLPGAETSGLERPSRVGPALDKKDSFAPASRASYAPTTIVLRPQARDPSVCKLSFAEAKVDGFASLRSIQAWNAPDCTVDPCRRTVHVPAGSPLSSRRPI